MFDFCITNKYNIAFLGGGDEDTVCYASSSSPENLGENSAQMGNTGCYLFCDPANNPKLNAQWNDTVIPGLANANSNACQ